MKTIIIFLRNLIGYTIFFIFFGVIFVFSFIESRIEKISPRFRNWRSRVRARQFADFLCGKPGRAFFGLISFNGKN